MSTKIDAKLIRKLREKTGAPMFDIKKVLDEVLGDLPANATHQALQAGEKKAVEILTKKGFEKAAKKADRKTPQGLLEAYIHHSGRVASVVEVFCETDFVARNELFKNLAHDLALQVASMGAANAKELEAQTFIKDPNKKVLEIVKEVIAKTGENIRIGRIFRVELGK